LKEKPEGYIKDWPSEKKIIKEIKTIKHSVGNGKKIMSTAF